MSCLLVTSATSSATGRPSGPFPRPSPVGRAASAVTAYERITERLAEVTGYRPARDGDCWRCPAHDDRDPSLSVSHGHRGPVLHCHAGCSVNAVLDRLDLPASALFDDAGEASNGKGAVVASYDYVDEDGTGCSRSSATPRRTSGSAGRTATEVGSTRPRVYANPFTTCPKSWER